MTVKDYQSVLETAGPRLKEYVLRDAEKDPRLTPEECLSLVRTAYPDEAP